MADGFVSNSYFPDLPSYFDLNEWMTNNDIPEEALDIDLDFADFDALPAHLSNDDLVSNEYRQPEIGEPLRHQQQFENGPTRDQSNSAPASSEDEQSQMPSGSFTADQPPPSYCQPHQIRYIETQSSNNLQERGVEDDQTPLDSSFVEGLPHEDPALTALMADPSLTNDASKEVLQDPRFDTPVGTSMETPAAQVGGGAAEHLHEEDTAPIFQHPAGLFKKRKATTSLPNPSGSKRARSDASTLHLSTAVGEVAPATATIAPQPNSVLQYQDIFKSRADAFNCLHRTGDLVEYKKLDIDEDDVGCIDEEYLAQLRTELFEGLLQSPVDVSMSSKHQARFAEVKERLGTEQDLRDASARIFLLCEQVMQIHDPEKGIAAADLTSDLKKTKGGFRVDDRTKCTERFEKIKKILREDKYVVRDLIDLSNGVVVRDLACAPDAYAGRKSTNSKGNRTKEELQALGRQARDDNGGEEKETAAKGSKKKGSKKAFQAAGGVENVAAGGETEDVGMLSRTPRECEG